MIKRSGNYLINGPATGEKTMSSMKQDWLKRESHINRVIAKVQKMCKQAEEGQCVQPAMREELEEMLFSYVK